MPISDTEAVGYGLLAMYAEDMYSPVGSLHPTADSRIAAASGIAAAGWKVVGYLTALEALFPPQKTLSLDNARRVFFGFVAQDNSNPNSYVAAVRGTDGIVEWVIDAEFVPIPHPRHPGSTVEQGFWNIYQTMSLADPATGVTTHQNAAEGIEKLVGTAGTIVVIGHSLGSALATYLAEDLSERLPSRVSACLFASPHTGNSTWVSLFDNNIGNYRLFNYILDIVTHVPALLGFAALPKVTEIQPGTGQGGLVAQAGIELSLLCNHHVICYCAMIDNTVVRPTTSADTSCKACILAPPAGMPESAKALALIIDELGLADERAVVMLEALHTVNDMTAAAQTPVALTQ
jgi:triacylglycerol lipase